MAMDVANIGIENHASRSWPCGVPKGEPPGLMTGLSGIGYFYLRLLDPIKNPSVLVTI